LLTEVFKIREEVPYYQKFHSGWPIKYILRTMFRSIKDYSHSQSKANGDDELKMTDKAYDIIFGRARISNTGTKAKEGKPKPAGKENTKVGSTKEGAKGGAAKSSTKAGVSKEKVAAKVRPGLCHVNPTHAFAYTYLAFARTLPRQDLRIWYEEELGPSPTAIETGEDDPDQFWSASKGQESAC
jgi:hypothetical protein